MSAVHLSRAAKRWQEIVKDPELSQRPERIETDTRCEVMMAPPPDFIHRSQAKEIQLSLTGCLVRQEHSPNNPLRLPSERSK